MAALARTHKSVSAFLSNRWVMIGKAVLSLRIPSVWQAPLRALASLPVTMVRRVVRSEELRERFPNSTAA